MSRTCTFGGTEWQCVVGTNSEGMVGEAPLISESGLTGSCTSHKALLANSRQFYVIASGGYYDGAPLEFSTKRSDTKQIANVMSVFVCSALAR